MKAGNFEFIFKFVAVFLLVVPTVSSAAPDPECVEGNRALAKAGLPASAASASPMTLTKTPAEAKQERQKLAEGFWRAHRDSHPYAIGGRDFYRDEMIDLLLERGVIRDRDSLPTHLNDAGLYQWLNREYTRALFDRTLERERRENRIKSLRAAGIISGRNPLPRNVEERALNDFVNREFEKAVESGKIKDPEAPSKLTEALATQFKRTFGREFRDSQGRGIEEATALILSEGSSLIGTAYRTSRWDTGRPVFFEAVVRNRDDQHSNIHLTALDRNRGWGSQELGGLPPIWYETHRVNGIFPQYDVRPEARAILREKVKDKLVDEHGLDRDYVDFIWSRFELDTSGRVSPILSTAENGSLDFLSRHPR